MDLDEDNGAVASQPPPAEQTKRQAASATPAPQDKGQSGAGPVKLKHLVVDSGAIIKGAGRTLALSAETFWTVPEVVSEIRDSKARHHLETLPFELKLREPSEEAVKFAVGFARRTGDLQALSRVDLRVIALTYMLEREETGGSHLRTDPAKPGNSRSKRGSAGGAGAPPLHTGERDAAAGPSGGPGMMEVAEDGGEEEEEDEEEDGEEEEEEDGEAQEDGEWAQAWEGEEEDQNSEDEDEDGEEEHDNEQVEHGDGSEPPEPLARASDGLPEAPGPASLTSASDFPALGGSVEGEFPTTTMAAAAAASPAGNPAAPSSWSAIASSSPGPFRPLARPDTTLPMGAAAAEGAEEVGTQPPNPPTAAEQTAAAAAAAAGGGAGGGARQSRILGGGAGTGAVVSGGSGGGGEDDDEDGWVTPGNLKQRRAAGLSLTGRGTTFMGGGRRNPSRTGCVTTDFAMQNVLIQVGLPLVSVDGMAVRRVKQWVLRCSACFKLCPDMGRLFCPVCGNAAMTRVSCSLDGGTGRLRVHLKKGYKTNLRGTKFSLPRPRGAAGSGGKGPKKGARFDGGLLLREDQLLSGVWAQKAKRTVKDVSSSFGEDITHKVGMSISKSPDIVVGYGRKNPNAAKGRERRGKKKSSGGRN